MLTETYRKPRPVAPPDEDGTIDHRRLDNEMAERLRLLRETGFETVADVEARRQHLRLDSAQSFFNELTGKELKLWKRFLPTTTARDGFKFDHPPAEALQAIRDAEQLQLFDRIEVWTPEGNSFRAIFADFLGAAKDKIAELGSKIDPMAVGVIEDAKGQQHYFPITRWGESLLPIEQIRRHVNKVVWRSRFTFQVLPLAALIVGISAFYNGIVVHGYGNMFTWAFVAVAATFVLGFLAVLCADIFRHVKRQRSQR